MSEPVNTILIASKRKVIPVRLERKIAHSFGWWVMERHTVCRACDKYTQTDATGHCRKCWLGWQQ